jgi:acetyl esterase/lipase
MKINKLFLLISIILSFTCNNARSQNYITMQKDTSYTVNSTYVKLVKQYPTISIYNPKSPDNIKVKRDLIYTKYEEREMHLDLFYPKKKSKEGYPVVLFIHGGGWRSGDKSMDWQMAGQLAAEGYVTATIEYRLSTEAHYPAPIYDIKTAIRFLRSIANKYSIDTNRFAICGVSAGGQLAALLAMENGDGTFPDKGDYLKYSSKVQASIDIDGILCFIHPEAQEGEDKPGKLSAATQWFGVPWKDDRTKWDEASALFHANKNSTPILFIASAQPRFNAGREDLIIKLNELKIYSEVKKIPDSPHSFWLFNPWAEPCIKFMKDFLKQVFH